VNQDLLVRFRGVRGTYPAPGVGTLRYGGNTSCVEIWAGERLLILDAGTGIIGLGRDLVRKSAATKQPIVAHLFLSHTHADHTQGLPFFGPARQGTSTLYIFGSKNLDEDLEDTLARAMLPPSFPVRLDELPSLQVINNVSHNEVILIGPGLEPRICNAFRDEAASVACEGLDPAQTVRVSIMQSFFHPSGDVSIFKIEWGGKSVVYATDTEGAVGGDMRLIRFCQGCDLLIHDAQYTTAEYLSTPLQGWGHSTPRMAALVAQKAQVKQLALFHHDPRHDDAQIDEIEAQAQALFEPTFAAREGLALHL
jgi:phosphoribosyl 1,2-cyclic phosphodiesterase